MAYVSFDDLGFSEKRSLQRSLIDLNESLSGALAFNVKREIQKRKKGVLTALKIIGTEPEAVADNPILVKKKALFAYLTGEFKSLPLPLQTYSSQTLVGLYNSYVKVQTDSEFDDQFWAAWKEIMRAAPVIDAEADISLFEHFKATAKPIEIDTEAVKALDDEIKNLCRNYDALYTPEFKARIDESTKKFQELTKEIYSTQGWMMDYQRDSKEYLDLRARIDALAEERQQLGNAINKERMDKDAERMDKIEALRTQMDAHGITIIEAMHAHSTIDHEQAKTWADKQIIDDDAIKKFKRSDYKPEQIRADMAEFYRLTGGKLANIEIATAKRNRRAYATGITEVESVIVPGAKFNKETLWHEMAHHLEFDPVAQKAAQQFLLKRREGNKLHRLKNLVPGSNYGKDELAYKDDFINPYIGKYYAHGSTEVFSMGVQYLSSPRLAARFKAKDPEMFDFITSYLQQPQTLSTQLALGRKEEIYESVKEAKSAENEAKKVVEQTLDEAITTLANTITIVKDNWYGGLPSEEKRYITDWYRDSDINYLGSVSSSDGEKLFALFDGKFRKRKTQRFAKGFMVIDIRSIKNHSFVSERFHMPLEKIKAMFKIAMLLENNSFYDASWRYFGWDGNKPDYQKIFQAAEMINAQ